MTIQTSTVSPRTSALPRPVAMRLARDEYARCVDLLRALNPDDWTRQTDCPAWDVKALAGHMLGMVELAASIREGQRQIRAASKRGGVHIDALTALQVEEAARLTPEALVDRFAARAPKAVRGRRFTPPFVRNRTMPQAQTVGGRDERWTLGYLIDTILTRDPWLHRIDIARATGAQPVLTAEHDGALVADVVAEWATRHGEPCTLELSGPAGGTWTFGSGGPHVAADGVEFCRILSGRGSGDGLLATAVPF